MNRIFPNLAIACATLALGGLALSGRQVVAQQSQPKAVLELFTSQGCSSCPAADALFVELARDPNVIALTLPVDYWDYLGWKDTLAQPAFSARQKGYAQLRGDSNVYTPQAVVNGVAHVVGSDRAAVHSASVTASLPVRVSATESDGMVRIGVSAISGGARSGTVYVLPVVRSRDVAIARGENRSRRITYANVVRDMIPVGEWTGGEAKFEIPVRNARAGDADGYVVLVQAIMPKSNGTMKSGPILGAVRSAGL